MISFKKCVQPNRRRDRETDIHTSLTGCHWGPSDPSVGIKAARRWTPTLGVNTNTKIAKGPWTTGRMGGLTYYTATQGICTRGLRMHVMRATMGQANDIPKSTRTNGQRERETEINISK